MKTIKFKHGMAPYQAGESASFEDKEADKIIGMGYATHVDEKRTKAKEEPPKDKMVSKVKTKKKS